MALRKNPEGKPKKKKRKKKGGQIQSKTLILFGQDSLAKEISRILLMKYRDKTRRREKKEKKTKNKKWGENDYEYQAVCECVTETRYRRKFKIKKKKKIRGTPKSRIRSCPTEMTGFKLYE